MNHSDYEQKLFDKEIDYYPLEKYITSKTPILHECLKGHQWKVTPSSILYGSGCPKCSKNSKKDPIVYSIQAKELGFTVLENYKGSSIPILHQHDICGYTWETRPNNVLQNSSCPNCYGNKIKSTDEYNLEISRRFMCVTEPYINSRTPIIHKHNCGHEWKIAPTNLKGCPKCAGHGFNVNKIGYVYLVEFSNNTETYYKIGVTNNKDISIRFSSDWVKFNCKLISTKEFINGKQALEEEKRLLSVHSPFKINTGLLISGNTETFSDKMNVNLF